MGHPASRRTDAPISDSAILEALPLTLIVFDDEGTITYATPRIADLLNPAGLVADIDVEGEIVGRNILEFVHPDDIDFAAELIEFGANLDRQLLGPMRLRYRTACGHERFTELWAENRLDHPGIRGHLVIVTEETSHHHFTEAVTSVAEQRELGAVVDSIANALSSHPVKGDGLLLERMADGTIRAASSTGLPASTLTSLAPLWSGEASRQLGAIVSLAINDLGSDGEAWIDRGVEAIWSLAIPLEGADLQLVCLRRRAGAPSPNQVRHLRQAGSLVRLAHTQESQRRQLEHLAYHDALTGLHNRAYLYGEVARRSLDGSAVLFVDLDGFKLVNDRHGHDAGDLLLRRVAEVLLRSVRAADTVARIGGDEFVVVCPPPSTPTSMQTLADRLIDQIAHIPILDGAEFSIGASVGIVHHGTHQDFDALIAEADAALYVAKAKGRGRWWMAPVE